MTKFKRSLLGLLLLATSACRSNKLPTTLIDSLYSYQSAQRVQRVLGVKRDTWEILQETHLLPGDKRPPHSTLSALVKNYSHLGYTGELVLDFYNDQLMETHFYPSDLEGYRKALEQKQRFRFDQDLGAKLGPTKRMWIGKDEKKRRYVGCRDLRLRQEEDDWIKKYS